MQLYWHGVRTLIAPGVVLEADVLSRRSWPSWHVIVRIIWRVLFPHNCNPHSWPLAASNCGCCSSGQRRSAPPNWSSGPAPSPCSPAVCRVGSWRGGGGCGGRSRSLGARSFPSGCPTSVALAMPLRFQLPPVEPCMRFSRTRLTDVVHRRHSVSPARPGRAGERRRFRQGRSVRGGSVIGRKPPNDHSRGCVGVVC